jgi:hypothetical protein
MRLHRTVFLLAVFALVLALPATAAPAGGESHCVVEVIGQRLTGEFLLGPQRCFNHRWEAAAATSQGVVSFSSFVLGVHYDGANGTGSSISVMGSSCTGGWWNTGATWANRISSSYNGCGRLRHYDGPNKTGAWEDTTGVGTTDNLGVMNNRTESVAYLSS